MTTSPVLKGLSSQLDRLLINGQTSHLGISEDKTILTETHQIYLSPQVHSNAFKKW